MLNCNNFPFKYYNYHKCSIHGLSYFLISNLYSIISGARESVNDSCVKLCLDTVFGGIAFTSVPRSIMAFVRPSNLRVDHDDVVRDCILGVLSDIIDPFALG